MKKRVFFTPVLIATALATLALFSLVPMNIGTAQEEKGPCPKPYIRVIFPKTGKPGDQVVIRGRRFGTEPGEVFFSRKVKAKVLEWTNSRIWVIIPQSATTGHVTVAVPCGSVSNTSYFRVIE